MARSNAPHKESSPFDRARELYSTLSRGDRRALFLLIVLPILIYVPFSLTGHPVVPGDNLTQNLPLRALAGNIIRSGNLPVWNPLVFSGTPLLGGWNAGAMYPATWLFVFIPLVAAWTINLVAVPIICATGTFVFLRRLRCRPLSATIGALAFTYTGFMSGQIVHLGLVEGTSFLPWALVAIDGIFCETTRRNMVGYVALLGVSLSAMVLAGDPRAATSGPIVAGVYVLACIFRKGRGALLPLAATISGACLGVLLSAIQWLPGLNFLHNSQRGVTVYDFFGSGSIGIAHLASLVLVPYLLGGNGNFGMPLYEGNYNLPEITMGTGLISLVAAFAFLPELFSTFVRFVRARRNSSDASTIKGKPLGVWYVVIFLGVLLTLGTTTPLGHVLVHLPLYGSERLQNRNAAIFDFALVVLLAFFIDAFIPEHNTYAEATKHSSKPVSARMVLGGPFGRALAALPLIGAIVLILASYVAPLDMASRLHDLNAFEGLFKSMSGYLIPTLAIAVAGAIFVFFHRRISKRYQLVALSVVAICELALLSVNASYATVSTSVLGSKTPYSQSIARLDGAFGRYAIYDPLFYLPWTQTSAPDEAGISDINILQNNPSVQGYGSLVQNVYQNATQTHGFEDLATLRLDGETFNSLDLRTLLTLPEYFGQVLAAKAPVPVPVPTPLRARSGAIEHGATVYDTGVAGPWRIQPMGSLSLTVPGVMTVVRAEVFGQGQTGEQLQRLHVFFVGPNDKTAPASLYAKDQQVYFLAPALAPTTSILIENPTENAQLIAALVIVTHDPDERFVLDGPLEGELVPPHWVYEGMVGPYFAYGNSETRGLSWLQPVGTKTPETKDVAAGSVTIKSSSSSGSQVMIVNAEEDALLVRSETYSPGWIATISPLGSGPTLTKSARRYGLIQTVEVPKGRYLVTWRYKTKQVRFGLILSGFGLLMLIGLLLCYLGLFRSRRANSAH